MRRPVAAVRTPTAKASREPDIIATARKRKRFGENTGVGSGCFWSFLHPLQINAFYECRK
ncbi:hypothetical protein IKG02_02055 [Candidatus Saccharibacteria bacterium]|nr:hypothetical protein [Candidatus Saccharibacteria bacterium]